VPLPLLFEVGTTSSAFVLCMFHGPQYVSSAASLPGGVKLPVTIRKLPSLERPKDLLDGLPKSEMLISI
jgi:hypothetical protein